MSIKNYKLGIHTAVGVYLSFRGESNLKNFSISSVTNMIGMFREYPNVQIFDASNLRVGPETSIKNMFSCSKTAPLFLFAPNT